MFGAPDFFKQFYGFCLSSRKEDRKFQGFKNFEFFLNNALKDFKNSNFNLWELLLFSPLHQLLTREEWSQALKITHDFILKNNLPASLNATHSPYGFDSPILETWIYNGSKHLDKTLIEELVLYGWKVDKEFYNKNLRMMEGYETWDPQSEYRWNFAKAHELWLSYFKTLDLSLENQILARQHCPKPSSKF